MWLQKHWGLLTTIFLSGLYIYLQLLEWQKHGDDFMLTAASIVVTAALWVFLLISVRHYRKDQLQAGSTQAKLDNASAQYRVELAAAEKQQKQRVDALKAQNDNLVRELASKQDEFNERDKRYRTEVQQLTNRTRTGWPYHGENLGFRLEAAMFGAQGRDPQEVTPKVRAYLDRGEDSIPVSWQLLLGDDPRGGYYKFLTVTFSITQIEGKPLIFPMLEAKMEVKPSPPDPLVGIEDGVFHRVRGKFINLPWQQKIALKLVLEQTAIPLSGLVLAMENHGFAQPRETVRKLLEGSILVKTNRSGFDLDLQFNTADTEVSIESSDVMRILRKLFKETPLC